jgi:hypothetical protein
MVQVRQATEIPRRKLPLLRLHSPRMQSIGMGGCGIGAQSLRQNLPVKVRFMPAARLSSSECRNCPADRHSAEDQLQNAQAGKRSAPGSAQHPR